MSVFPDLASLSVEPQIGLSSFFKLNPVTGTFPAPWGVSVIKKDWKFDTPLLAAGQFI